MATKTVYKKSSLSKSESKKKPAKKASSEESILVSKKLLENVRQDLQKIARRPMGFHVFPHENHIKFDTQEAKEKILVLMRAHIITNYRWILGALLFFTISIFLFLFTPFLSIMPGNYAFMTVLIWFLFLITYITEKALSWYFNVYIITDERVVDIDFYSLTAKRISETKIDRIEDVSYSQGGFLQSFFNYGTVDIQTSAEKAEFEFEDIPYPERIASALNTLILHEEQEKIEGRIS